MEIRSTSDMHTPSFAENVKEAKTMHQINNTETVSEAITNDIKQSLIEGQQKAAQNIDHSNVAALMGRGTQLNIMA
jgi:hypothetical protein